MTYRTSSYYLSRLEVYNWGGFSGFHKAMIDEQGTAIIGQTGSGKTTLIDALMTLLTARPSYNLASTGGHESDRDLMSYIRGSLGAGEGLETVARSGKTITALTAYFQPVNDSPSDSEQETQADLFSEDISQEQSVSDNNQTEIAIGVIYWLDSSSNSNSDRKDVWLVSEHHGSGLKDWLDCFLEGGSRGLKKWVKSEDNLDIYDSKKSYLAKIKRLFKVTDQAFTLLNKAVGLKQLNSVDEIFRKLVLDGVSTFKRAEEVIAQFDDLTQIKATLETAKRQQQSLNPLRKLHDTWQQQQNQLADIQQMITILPLWFAKHGKELWQQQITQLTKQLSKQQQQFQQVSNEAEQQQIRYHSYLEKYHQQGGGELQQLSEQITGQKSLLAKTQKNYQQYQQLISNLHLTPISTLAEFNQQKQQIAQLNVELQQQIDKTQEQMYVIGAEKHTLQTEISELQTQLQQANAQKSNIPLKFEQFKEQLAKHLQVDMGRLPYVAQLIEVQAEHSQWRGAMGSHRLRLLIPPNLMQSALHWVNQRNNHLHVRLYNAVEPEKSAQFFSDGFLRKLNFKQHELSEPLKQLLTNLDRHCVENTHDLENTAHAMTKEGLMSAKQGWYDKQDQKNLTADWLTGFDNKDLLQQINQQLNEKTNALHKVQEKFNNLAKQIRNYQQQQQQITMLQRIDYSQIDCVTVENTLQKLQQRYDILNAPNSELSQLKHNYEQAQQQLNQLQQQVNNLQVAIQLTENDINKAQQKQQQSVNIINKNKKPNQLIIDTLAKQFTAPTFEQIEELAQLEKSYHNQLIEQQNNVTNEKSKTENSLIRQMGKAKQQDTGALSEVGTELQDLEDYLQRLDYLTHEDLPSKQQRFIDYLNESSQASVSQLLKDIEYEVEKITDRIDSLNHIMKQVDFEHDKYLRLNAQKVVHTSLRQLQNAQRKLRAKALTTDNTDGEEHYQALQALIAQLQQAVDKKHTLSAKALLDPRHRLTFSVSVMSRTDDSELEHRTGSQGGSGGEKEIIASHILTASLSYALSPTTNTAPTDKMAKPKFSTIVLDEAFSKSSPKVATRIVEAIRAFGLHPLFVTPNKEMRLLRDHTRSAVLVVRKGNFANLLNCSWQQIDKVAQGNSL